MIDDELLKRGIQNGAIRFENEGGEILVDRKSAEEYRQSLSENNRPPSVPDLPKKENDVSAEEEREIKELTLIVSEMAGRMNAMKTFYKFLSDVNRREEEYDYDFAGNIALEHSKLIDEYKPLEKKLFDLIEAVNDKRLSAGKEIYPLMISMLLQTKEAQESNKKEFESISSSYIALQMEHIRKKIEGFDSQKI